MMLMLVAPAFIGAGLAVGAATLGHRRLSPAIAARLLTLIAVSSLMTVVAATALLASGVAARAGLRSWFAWCAQVIPVHDAIPSPATEGAALLLVAMGIGAFRFARRWRRSLARWGAVDGLEVIDVDEPIAYAVPGAPGHVVVSRGLLRELEPRERTALIEHERAHLRFRHSRYLRLAGLSASAFPLLRPVADEVKYVTERWADEIAAAAVGSRQVVASAIARAALASTPMGAMGLGDSDVASRIQALVEPNAKRIAWWPSIGLCIATLGCVVATATQAHHLVNYALHVCRVA